MFNLNVEGEVDKVHVGDKGAHEGFLLHDSGLVVDTAAHEGHLDFDRRRPYDVLDVQARVPELIQIRVLHVCLENVKKR